MKNRIFSLFTLLCTLCVLLLALSALMQPRGVTAANDVPRTDSSEPLIASTEFYTTFLPLFLNGYQPDLLYHDSFSDPQSGWLTHNTSSAQWRYQADSYDILVQQFYSWGGVRAPFIPPSSYSIQADMWRLDSLPSIYGLVFNQSDWKHYDVFALDPESQSYALWRINNGDRLYLMGWTPSPAINPAGASNTLRVQRDAQQIKLYANNTLLLTLPDTTSPTTQRVGLYAESRESTAAIRFDNFRVAGRVAANESPSEDSSLNNGCDGGEGIYLYDLPSYQGACTKLTDNLSSLSATTLGDNAASAIRFVGIWRATLYDLAAYQGDSTSFTQDDPDFGNDLINHNRASSLRVQSGGAGDACSPRSQFCTSYYSNRTLSGNPTFTRNESTIDHNWGSDGPGNGLPTDGFSVRWVGRFSFASGVYTFIARADDGVRVWVDGVPIIDEWRDQTTNEYRVARTLTAGEHEIKVEYYEGAGGALAQVRWVTGCPVGEYLAEYYSNPTLSGTPVFTRNEGCITHEWGNDGPGNGIPVDNFSVRWTGRFLFTEGNHTFIAHTDDGMRVWLDGTLILDQWRDQSLNEYRITVPVLAGEHQVKVEYYEGIGSATAQLRWALNCPTGQYRAEYYSNPTLSGTPSLMTCESALNHDWGTAAPGAGLPTDNFSARWTGRFLFSEGDYTFTARTDDGMRVWLNGNLIVDEWRGQSVQEYRVTRYLSAGEHEIKVEYFEVNSTALAQLTWARTRVNLTLGRPAWATSVEGTSYAPDKGNDGNLTTRWSSQISSTLPDQWWWTDLGAPTAFAQVIVTWDSAYAAEHCIAWSDDGVNFVGNWYTISAPGVYAYNIGPRTARYLGVFMHKRAPNMNNYSFWEYEAYQAPAINTDYATPQIVLQADIPCPGVLTMAPQNRP